VIIENGISSKSVFYKCKNCALKNEDKCPRSKEVDEFGDQVRLFATECAKWQPYYDRYYCDNKPSAIFIESRRFSASRIY
jgi:hypothetical protein